MKEIQAAEKAPCVAAADLDDFVINLKNHIVKI